MIDLTVPFTQKDIVKNLGAKWNPIEKKWQIKEDEKEKFSKWIEIPENERKATNGQLLTIELVPETCWFSNVRNHVDQDMWKKIKSATFFNAGNKCEICNGTGNKHPVECHEIFVYDDKKNIQKLKKCIALCPKCHEVKHMGLAGINGREKIAINWLSQINGWSKKETRNYVENKFLEYNLRSIKQWKLDLSWLKENFGIEIKEER